MGNEKLKDTRLPWTHAELALVIDELAKLRGPKSDKAQAWRNVRSYLKGEFVDMTMERLITGTLRDLNLAKAPPKLAPIFARHHIEQRGFPPVWLDMNLVHSVCQKKDPPKREKLLPRKFKKFLKARKKSTVQDILDMTK